MKILSYLCGILILIGLTAMAQDGNSPPEVTNVVAQQVGQQVEITYDLLDRDGDLMTVSLRVSSDGGSNFDLPVISAEGEIGGGISSGIGKTIVWRVGQDVPDFYSTDVVFEVVADDGVRPPELITWEKDGSEMAPIPAGSFEMGDAMNEPEDWMKRSKPMHTVQLDAFYMDVNEVTVGQFKKFLDQSGYSYVRWNSFLAAYSPSDEHPMVFVNYYDARAYATWAGKRLPTEAEWEYAARGGLVGKRYPGGDEISHDDANYLGTGGKDKWGVHAPVGSFNANRYGLYDMAGNVYEWCMDWYSEDYYSKSPAENPSGPSTGQYRVVRGGYWRSLPNRLRVAHRSYYLPGNGENSTIGFRCVSARP